MQVMYSHWGVWSFARILHVVHRTCSQWWRKVAAELFRSIFGLRTLNQRVFRPLNKRQDQRSNSVGRFFPLFLVPSPRQTKQSKISRKFRRNAFWFAPFDRQQKVKIDLDWVLYFLNFHAQINLKYRKKYAIYIVFLLMNFIHDTFPKQFIPLI